MRRIFWIRCLVLNAIYPRLIRGEFGLGSNGKMSEVRIRWPSGETEALRNVPADFIYTIVEGEGIREKTAIPKLAAAQ